MRDEFRVFLMDTYRKFKILVYYMYIIIIVYSLVGLTFSSKFDYKLFSNICEMMFARC